MTDERTCLAKRVVGVATVLGMFAIACGSPGGDEPSPTPFAAQRWCVGPGVSSNPALRGDPSGDLMEGHVTVVPLDPPAPVEVGQYRLVPRGYAGPSSLHVAIEQAGSPADYGSTRDINRLVQSRIYADINYAPPGFTFSRVEAVTLREIPVSIGWYFDGPLASEIQVIRTDLHIYRELKADVHLLGCGAAVAVDSALFRGHPMIVERDRDAASSRRLHLVADDALTEIDGTVGSVDELIKMLESFDPPISSVDTGTPADTPN